jgi:DNA-binding NarL/FixJ family response regulator
MIQVLLADDHPALREGTINVLLQEKDIQVIGFAENGAVLLNMLIDKKPDLILIDINMPVMNGLDAIKEIKVKYPEIKLIVFSQYDEKRFVKRVLKEGANGYLLKSANAEEIIKAIRMVMNGGMFLSEELPNVFTENSKSKTRPSYLFPELSSREKEILSLICDEKTSSEIAETLFISFNTVESHRSNILLKVGVKNTVGLVKWALENEIV